MNDILYPPGPRSRIPGQLLRRFRRDPISLLTEMAQVYGDISQVKIGPSRLYLLNNPDYIKDVLVTDHRNFRKSLVLQRTRILLGDGLLTSEGDLHLRQRRMIQPIFHRQRIANYADVMVAYANRTSKRWQALAGEDQALTLDISAEMMHLTLTIVAKTLFDEDVEEQTTEIGEAISIVMSLFSRLSSPIASLLSRLPLPSNRRFEQAKAQLDTTIQTMIAERRLTGDRGDLLSLLLQAQDSDGDGSGMSDQQVKDEALTLFLAGHETTSNALTWTWYLLSQNPSAEARLHAELDRVLAGRLPSASDFDRLEYTRMVFSEAMRMYPPAWVLGRQVIDHYPVDGYIIPSGSTVLMSQWVMHHDARYYPEPYTFRPERWAPEAQAGRPKFAYFPFGGGPRLCIGEPFAWMEGVLLLATLAQQWRMRLVPGHPVERLPLITLRPKFGMRMHLYRRQESFSNPQSMESIQPYAMEKSGLVDRTAE